MTAALLRCLVPVLAIFLQLVLISTSNAQNQAAAEAPTDRVARLSDAEVRALLLRELEEKAEATDQSGADNPAITSIQIQRQISWLGERLGAKFAAVGELPDVWRQALEKLKAPRENRTFGAFLLGVLVSFGLAFLIDYGLSRWLRPARLRVRELASPSLGGRATALGMDALIRLVALIVFIGVAVGIYWMFFDIDPTDRITFFFYVSALIIFRLATILSHFWHAPVDPRLRLPTLDDEPARRLHRTFLAAVALGAFGFYTCALFGLLGIHGHAHGLLLILVGTGTTAMLALTFLGNRQAITSMIMGRSRDDEVLFRLTFAQLWPWFLTILVILVWCYLLVKQLAGGHVGYGAGLLTIALAALLPAVDAILVDEANEPRSNEIEAAVMRTLRLAIPFLAVLLLAGAWRIDLTTRAENELMSAVAHAAVQMTATLFVAYLIWQVIRIWIDRAIAREDAVMAQSGQDLSEMEIGGAGLSRIRTLLPLLKGTVRVVLGAIALMIILSALGVDIGPLLAGVGVVGIAIGFGSQTLVRDIVSGAFFLLDDAFRLGEYIDVGAAKGAVEHMSIRSVRLRHHRGALHTVPFGEIAHLTNHSRDWAIMKLRFRVPFGADIERIRKMFKKIGQELLEHPDVKDDFIQPFKSQGVIEVDDYGLIIRAKFMSKPGRQFIIRRHAYRAVQEAFAEAGIEFGTPEVRVVVDEDEEDETGRSKGRSGEVKSAAAAQIATQPTPTEGVV
ncbi:MAG: mechanosensitive ion channel family protein [Geminicoccaceae bacterium]